MLGIEIELVPMPGRKIAGQIAQTWPNDCNIMQRPQIVDEKFDHFQI